jgi:hypothetical protein
MIDAMVGAGRMQQSQGPEEDEWDKHLDRLSGRAFFFNPQTG